MVLVVRLLESSCLALLELGSLQHAVLGLEVGTAAGSRAVTPPPPDGTGAAPWAAGGAPCSAGGLARGRGEGSSIPGFCSGGVKASRRSSQGTAA